MNMLENMTSKRFEEQTAAVVADAFRKTLFARVPFILILLQFFFLFVSRHFALVFNFLAGINF